MNRNKHQRPAEHRGVKAGRVVMAAMGRAGGMVVRDVKVDRVAAVPAVRVAGRAASASISARRKFASSASRRWT